MPIEQPGECESPTGPPAQLSFLALYSVKLNEDGRKEVRDSIPPEYHKAFDVILGIHDAREKADEGRSRQILAQTQYNQLRARDDAKRMRMEEEAAERGHVSSRILTYPQLKQLPRPRPLIWNVAYSGAVGVILGDSQTGKTWVMLSIAAAAASGMHWPKVPEDPTIRTPNPISVLYVAAEDGGSIGARLEHWERAHGKDLSEVQFDAHPSAINLLDDVQIDELCEAVRDNGYRLIIFDTVAASLGGEEEGNPQFSKMVQNMRKIVAATNGEGSVFLVHHFGKDKTKGARGGSSLFNDADIVWELTGTLDSMEMKCTKWKADSIRRPWHLRLNRADKDAVHIMATDAPSGESIGVHTDPQKILEEQIFKAVTEFGRENQGYGPSGTTIAGYLRAKNVSFTEVVFRQKLAIMVSEGKLIRKDGPRNAQLYRLPPVQDALS